MTAARQQADFGEVTRCLQKTTEPIPDFLARFKETWESCAGIPLADNHRLAVQTLVNCMQSRHAQTYKSHNLQWQGQSWPQVPTSLTNMDRQGLFDTKREKEAYPRLTGTWDQGN